jgi:hypothetical protein
MRGMILTIHSRTKQHRQRVSWNIAARSTVRKWWRSHAVKAIQIFQCQDFKAWCLVSELKVVLLTKSEVVPVLDATVVGDILETQGLKSESLS